MSNTQSAQEPSMEEILASIRKIISEDDGTSASTDAKARPQEAAASATTNGFGAFSNGARSAAPNGSADEAAAPAAAPAYANGHADSHGDTAVAEAPGEPGGAAAAAFKPAAAAFGQGAAARDAGDGAGHGAANGQYSPGGEFEGVPAQEGDEVLDLTEMVASDGRVVKITPQGLANGQADGEVADPASAESAASEAAYDPTYQDSTYQTGGADATSFGASFGQAAQQADDAYTAGAYDRVPEEEGGADQGGHAEDLAHRTGQAETGADDQVAYSQADLEGTPAYMAVTGAQAAHETGGEPNAERADDAFAELAGTEKQDTSDMTDSTQSQEATADRNAEPQAFGQGGFAGAAANGAVNGASHSAADAGAGLEAIVRKTADPMIRQWIEENMADVVERLVREEVARRLSGNG